MAYRIMVFTILFVAVGVLFEVSETKAVAELPRAYVDINMPTTTVTKWVCDTGCDYNNTELQKAIDEAQPGTTIMLQPGASYVGSVERGFVLRNKIGAGWIIIQSATPDGDLPPPGSRITPAAEPKLAKLVRAGLEAISCDAGAHHYRIMLVEFKKTDDPNAFRDPQGALVDCGRETTVLGDFPHHIVFDRVYAHGPAAAGDDVRRGIFLQGIHQALIDSWIADIKIDGFDAAGVGSWAGPGPFKIANNYIEASSENIAFGGADPQVQNITPSDIEISRNYVTKPLRWRDDPAYKSLLIKNLYESKNSQRVLIEGNLFEYSWFAAQNFAFVLKSVNSSWMAPWSVTQDYTIRNNTIRHVDSGINLCRLCSDGIPSLPAKRFTITNNLFDDVGWGNGDGIVLQVIDGVDDVVFEHNTAFQTGTILLAAPGTPSANFIFRNNIAPHNQYGVFGGGAGIGTVGLNVYFPGALFERNVITYTDPSYTWLPSSYPPNNIFVQTDAKALGFIDPANGNYRLVATSPYKRTATDGKDIGVVWEDFDPAGQAVSSVSRLAPTSSSLAAVALATPTLTVNGGSAPITVAALGTVVVGILNGPGSAADWVGLYRVGISDTGYTDYAYAKSASLSFSLPSTPGVYEFRFFANNGYTKLATSPTVTIPGATTVTVNGSSAPITVAALATVVVGILNGPGSTADWVGLYRVGTPDTGYTDYAYAKSTSLSFSLPSTPGVYEFRFFANNEYLKLATSPPITIQ